MKRLLVALIVVLLTGCASSPQRAQLAITADGLSTAYGLVRGGREVGPFGWWGIPLRFGIVEIAKRLPSEEGEPVIDVTDASSWGYALGNVLLAFGPGAWIVGGSIGAMVYERAQFAREKARQCAIHRLGNTALVCNF